MDSATQPMSKMPAGGAVATEQADDAPGDQLFLIAEELARDSSLVPEREREFDPPLHGVLSEADVLRRANALDHLDIDSYIEAVMTAADDPSASPRRTSSGA